MNKMILIVAALLLAVNLTGCHSWHPVTVSPRQFIEEEQPDRIRVWRQGVPSTEVRYPLIEGDILTSTVPSEPPVGIALTDITRIDVRRFSQRQTLALVLGVAAASALVVGLIMAASIDLGGGSGWGFGY